MNQDLRGDLTALLDEARGGCEDARDRLFRAVYGELHRMAEALMAGERPGHTLQPSALVNEALIRMFHDDVLAKAPNRRYLLAAAAQAMREVLVDHARRRGAAKRAGARRRVPLNEAIDVGQQEPLEPLDILALHEALDRLTQLHERQALVVVLRYFAGLSIAEVAEVLEICTTTVENDWRIARAWLHSQLGEATP
jgi:RNA polymerase sigma factor (TIGR02999 family)